MQIDWFLYSANVLECVNNVQKQPMKVFYRKRCSYKFRKIQRKVPVLKSLFNKINNDFLLKSSCEFCKVFKNDIFSEDLRLTAFECLANASTLEPCPWENIFGKNLGINTICKCILFLDCDHTTRNSRCWQVFYSKTN